MSRYLLFFGSVYYPAGGWSDMRCDSDDLNSIKESLARLVADYQFSMGECWYEIVADQSVVIEAKTLDKVDGKIVAVKDAS